MTDRDLRDLSAKFARYDRRIQALETAPQLATSSVDVPDGEGGTVPVTMPQIAVQTAALDAALEANKAEVEAGMSELGDRLGTAETELATTKENVATVETDVATALDQASGALAEAQAVGQQVDVVSGAVQAAQADATAAQQTASQAQSTAASAASAASTAQQAASSAQSTADTAKADAATAAGIAGGKADVLIQSATPAASFRVATTLWIDTTGGANTPKRWSGSAWVVVTDRAATDAAAAAAAAQATASNAATAAATAQSKADQAAAAAAAAATAAGNAQASADGKNTVWYQATAPAGTSHKTGDTWFDTANGYRISRWSGSAWTLVQLGGGALANGAVTATQIASAVTDSITAAQTTATAAQSAASAAATAAASAQTTADGRNRTLYGTAAPTTSTPGVPGDIFWVRSGNTIAGQYLCTAGTMATTGNTWTAQTLTNATIATLDAAKITTGTLAAGRIAAGSITGSMLAADTVQAGNIAADAVGASELAAGAITAGSAVIANGAIGTAQIGTGQITNALIADATIQAAKIGSVDAGKITVGTLDAARIGARSITADKVVIGGSANLMPDAFFTTVTTPNGDGSHFYFSDGGGTFSTTGGYTGGGCAIASQGGVQRTWLVRNAMTYLALAEPTRIYVYSAWVYSSVAVSADTLRFVIYRYATDGTLINSGSLAPANPATIPANAWTKISTDVYAGSAATGIGYLRMGGRVLDTHPGSVIWSDTAITLKADASLIVDGAVTADKIAANAVTAAKMVAGTITAESGILADAVIETAKIKDAAVTNAKVSSLEVGKLTATSATVQTAVAQAIWAAKITASKIVAGDIAAGAITATALAADAIDGKTITGATIQTNKSAVGVGSGMRLTESSFVAWNGTTEVIEMSDGRFYSANTVSTVGVREEAVIAHGSAVFTATDATGSPIASLEISPQYIEVYSDAADYWPIRGLGIEIMGDLRVVGYNSEAPTLSNIASGWSVTVVSCIRKSGWCLLNLAPTPSSAWETGSMGNVTDVALCTVNGLGFRPPVATYAAGNNNTILAGSITAGGNVTLSATAGGLTAGQTNARLQFIYPVT